ncbi:MAG: hypothetical protein RMJ56_15005 [Gemmataceae bacterium]|nr:hypothetical protein [Gemmata sp.]MDW8198905.1 hypothetical protein [Gemmataceae bacterium]
MKSLLVPTLLGACVLGLSADDKKPSSPPPKLPLGKDTTFVTGPLDKHGYIDYEAALNAELSKNVTRDNNAKVLLLEALGPAPEGGDGFPLAYYKWLDIPPLPRDGDYFISQYKYVRDQLGITGEKLEALQDLQYRLNQRPWKADDCPPLAEWLKVNDKHLAKVAEAVKRPEYFNPLVSRRAEGESSHLIGALLPSVQKCRDLAQALTLRAMLHIHAGQLERAWDDLLTCHRLGRLIARGATLIEALVGFAICQIATQATITYIEHAHLDAKQALAHLRAIQQLPAIPPLADKIDLAERFMGLDSLQMIRRGGLGALKGIVDDDEKPIADTEKALELLDWAVMLQTVNRWYDRMAAAMRIKDRTARVKEFQKIEDDFQAIKKELADAEKVKKQLAGPEAGQVVARSIANTLMSLLAPAIRRISAAQERAEQVAMNLQIALALAAYHNDNGKYPDKLTDLAPKYLAQVPHDGFSGQPLIYKPTAQGYLLYSVGMNGQDDGGKTFDDDPPGDDLRVQIPQPPLKKK